MSELVLEETKKISAQIDQYRDLIHIIIGPRQIGKATAAMQIAENFPREKVYKTSADGDVLKPPGWLRVIWSEAMAKTCDLLIVDEIQKIENWSEVIKDLWDNRERDFVLLLLGSSSMKIHKGLSESLTGRYLLHRFMHWNFLESAILATMSLQDFLRFGGYPGSYRFYKETETWLGYLNNSIIEPVIGKDILSLVRVKSPALFRQCFEIACSYAGQEISYTKLLGQLQSKGNTDLVKHYLELFEAAFLMKTLHKFSSKPVLKKTSSPKILPLCPSLYSVTLDADYSNNDYDRAFEILVGSYLASLPGKLYYWRERNYEVDFVYQFGKAIHAIEVKYGKDRSTAGLQKFSEKFPTAKLHLVTQENYVALLKGDLIDSH